MPEVGAAKSNWLTILGWACYLACSWTWCIGMFLPVLLIRDYGIWGFVVFAVPNVVGAGAMGWVVKSNESSVVLVERHRTAMFVFSFITVLFQYFFLAWLLAWTGLLLWVLGLLAWVAVQEIQRRSRLRGYVALTTVLLVSIATIVAWTLERGSLDSRSNVSLDRLLPLALVCGFGFALCPYLDTTFHRARQRLSAGAARGAFSLGFGVIFLAMIVLTVLYAPAFTGSDAGGVLRAMSVPGILLILHLAMQMGFTVGAHSTELEALRQSPTEREQVVKFLLIRLFSVMGALGVGSVGNFVPDYHGLAFNEVVYRIFMAFYGLVFPAYVWLCMIPTWRSPRPPTRREIAVWLGACAVAAPAYWMGFIERREWWLVPGLAVVLLARLLVRRNGRGLDGRFGAPVPVPTRPMQGAGHAEAERP